MLYRWLRPVLWRLDAEAAHHLAVAALKLLAALPPIGWLLRRTFFQAAFDKRLAYELFGKRVLNPIGLAAGFDKNGEAIGGLQTLGFGFVEVGTVTPLGQPGNPKPRIFRLPKDEALINRLGFNNGGAAALRERLSRGHAGLVGVNIGKNKDTPADEAGSDYARVFSEVADVADYVVVNISSPNTPGLRRLQATEALRPLLARLLALRAESAVPALPLLIKVAPDLSDEDFDDVLTLALDLGMDGLVLTNTTIAREELATPRTELAEAGQGGLSGPPLRQRSLTLLRRAAQRARGRMVLISVGGVADVDDVWQRLEAGADAIQLYTSLVYRGPGLPAALSAGLLARLGAAGYESLPEYLAHRAARPSADAERISFRPRPAAS